MRFDIMLSDNKAKNLGFLVDEQYTLIIQVEKYIVINEYDEEVLLSDVVQTGVSICIN